jgi:hypothetical protein
MHPVGDLSSCDRANHNKWFFSRSDRFGQRSVGRLVRYILLAGKKA